MSDHHEPIDLDDLQRVAVLARERYGDNWLANMIELASEEIARLREERRWIPVGERLPDEGALVLWSANDEHWPQCVGKRRGNGVNWGGDLDSEIEQFTHWQPLPPPPGEGEVEG